MVFNRQTVFCTNAEEIIISKKLLTIKRLLYCLLKSCCLTKNQRVYKNALLIAVAGGSCSGKTTTVKYLKSIFGFEKSVIISQDSYYLDNSGVTPPKQANFDVPQAIDFNLLALHLSGLKAGRSVGVPVYDFVTHRRTNVINSTEVRPIVIVDGTLILHAKHLRDFFDFRIFVECEEDIRLKRRIERDVASRGRTEISVRKQFSSQVSPMHNKYVEPSKEYADLIINRNDCIDIVSGKSLESLKPLFRLATKQLSNFDHA